MYSSNVIEGSETGGDESSTMDAGDSMTTFTESMAEVWFKEDHGRLVQSSNEAYRWPADEWHLHHEELWTEWKMAFLSGGKGKDGVGRGLYPPAVAERVEELLSKKGSRYLHIGCGRRADWLCSVGDTFPLSEGAGIDTQPIVREFLPPIYDCSQNLPYPDEFFDVITHAYLCPFLIGDWTYSRLLKEIARCLKPGGVYFCIEKHTTSYGLNNGEPIQSGFPFMAAFLTKSSFWGERPSDSELARPDHRFRTDVLATEALELIEEEICITQVGKRNVDPHSDLLGEIFFRVCYHIFSHASWFLQRAGYSEEQSSIWEEKCLDELEGLRECEQGMGGFARLRLVYAVKKSDEAI